MLINVRMQTIVELSMTDRTNAMSKSVCHDADHIVCLFERTSDFVVSEQQIHKPA